MATQEQKLEGRFLKTKRLIAAVAGILAGTALLLVPGTISADQTPQMCDPTPKYHCVRTTYTPGPTTVTFTNREFKGARDGGAQQWRLEWVREYTWNGSSWIQQISFGPSAWYTNINFGSYLGYSAYTNRTKPAKVTYRFQFYECNPGCYYWTSETPWTW